MGRHKPTVYLDTNIHLCIAFPREGHHFTRATTQDTRMVGSGAKTFRTCNVRQNGRRTHPRIVSRTTCRDFRSTKTYVSWRVCGSQKMCSNISGSKAGTCLRIWGCNSIGIFNYPSSRLFVDVEPRASGQGGMQKQLESINRKHDWRSPWLVSPETIPWVSLGQNIRRRDE